MACTTPHSSMETCPDCAPFAPFERNNYFTGKFMTELDFKIETAFHSEKMRHHNRRLHGSGVVCGLKVVQDDNPACRDRFVVIQAGTAIDCCGREIVLKEAEQVQLDALPAIQELIRKNDGAFHRLQICLSYKECPTEPVPVLYDECGCDDSQCAPNRILESFEVGAVLDSALDLDHITAPRLKWEATASPAHAAQAVLDSAGGRLYVITASDNSLYALSTDNLSVIASHSFATRPVGLAVSRSGDRVYAALLPASGNNTDPRQLAVLDAANLGAAPLRAQDIPGSGGNDLLLSAAIQATGSALVILLRQKGDLQIWPAAVDAGGAALTPDTLSAAPNLAGLTFSSDGLTAYTLDPANNRVKVVDLEAKTLGNNLDVLPAGSQAVALATVTSSGADRLAVAGKAGPGTLYLLGINPPAKLGERALDHPPVDLAIAPGGDWAYVLEADGASFLQPVNLPNVIQDPARALGAPLEVGPNSTQVILSESGRRLFVPFTADLNAADQGGVAVISVEETACADIFWDALEGCPGCDRGDCLVLATIENYKPGFQLLDPADPPSDPLADKAASLARIDNRRGRRLLPSTASLAEAIECLFSRQAGEGKQGPPGDPGQSIGDVKINYIACDATPQKPTIQTINGVPTLVMDVPDGCMDVRVNPISCSQTPGAHIETAGGTRTLVLDLPPALKDVSVVVNKRGCNEEAGGSFSTTPNGSCVLTLNIPVNCDPVAPPPLDLVHICGISWPHNQIVKLGDETWQRIQKLGLLIAFDGEVLAETLSRDTFQVQYRPSAGSTKPDQGLPFLTSCYCDIVGTVSGVKTDLKCPEVIKDPPSGSDVNAGPVHLARFQPKYLNVAAPGLPAGEYRVVLLGDQVLGEKQIDVPGHKQVHPGVDANHMGPGVDNPPWLPPLPGARLSGDGVEGGTFISWFEIISL